MRWGVPTIPLPSGKRLDGRNLRLLAVASIGFTIAALVNELVEAKEQRMLSKLIGRYAARSFLVLDEMAYVPPDRGSTRSSSPL